MFRWLLNISKDGHSTISLRNLFMKCLIAQSQNELLHWRGGRGYPAFKTKKSFKCCCLGSRSTDLNRYLVAHQTSDFWSSDVNN